MATLTVTTQGEMTFGEDVLRHIGVRPGGRVTVDLLPEGRAELRAEPHPKRKGSWGDLIGFFDGKTNGARLSIDEINEAIAEAGAAAAWVSREDHCGHQRPPAGCSARRGSTGSSPKGVGLGGPGRDKPPCPL